MRTSGMAKQAFQGIGLALLILGTLFVFVYFFQEDVKLERNDPREIAIDGVTLPNGKKLGGFNQSDKIKEGSSSKEISHPDISEQEILRREVKFPKDLKGKWRAVKLLIKNKKNERDNKFKVVELGQRVKLGEGMTMTVGPFFPNFVMSELYYTSMNNQLLNPAVHLKIEDNGRTIYDGWAFARYPDLYAFEHDRYAVQLTDYLPEEVS